MYTYRDHHDNDEVRELLKSQKDTYIHTCIHVYIQIHTYIQTCMYTYRDQHDMDEVRELLKSQKDTLQNSLRDSALREKDLRAALAQSKRDCSQMRKRVCTFVCMCVYVCICICTERKTSVLRWHKANEIAHK